MPRISKVALTCVPGAKPSGVSASAFDSCLRLSILRLKRILCNISYKAALWPGLDQALRLQQVISGDHGIGAHALLARAPRTDGRREPAGSSRVRMRSASRSASCWVSVSAA